jgi:hypothetical protein
MKKSIKVFFGVILGLIGLGLMSIGGYSLLDLHWQTAIGISVPLICFGFLILYLGYDLIRGRSIKDDLYFIFFSF